MAENKTIEFVFAEFKKELQAMVDKVNETMVERLVEFNATMERPECNGKLKTFSLAESKYPSLFNHSRLVNRDVSCRSPDCGCSRHRCDRRRASWLLYLQEVQRSLTAQVNIYIIYLFSVW